MQVHHGACYMPAGMQLTRRLPETSGMLAEVVLTFVGKLIGRTGSKVEKQTELSDKRTIPFITRGLFIAREGPAGGRDESEPKQKRANSDKAAQRCWSFFFFP